MLNSYNFAIKQFSIIIVFVISAISMQAQTTYSISSNTNDVTINNANQRQWVGYHTHRIGTSKNISAIIPFQLPILQTGETAISADFTTQLTASAGGLNTEIDLYALPFRTTSIVLDSDYYAGTNDTSNNLIQESFLTLSSPIGKQSSNSQANIALVDFINQQYTNGAVGGEYIFIRLSFSENITNNYNQWDIASQDNSTASFRPLLNIETEISNANTPPVLANIGDVNIQLPNSKNIVVSASDEENDNLSFNTSTLPSFVTFVDNNNGTATLSINPSTANQGVYPLTISVSDGGFTDNETISIVVSAYQAPVAGVYYCDPVNGSNSNDGSQASPFSKFSSINWANINLKDDDIIYLMDGHHGSAYFNNQVFNSDVTIKAVNNHQAVFTKIQLVNVKHVKFEGVKFDATGGTFSTTSPIFYSDNQSTHITVENCIVQSAESSATWTKADWYEHSASGFQFRGGYITLKNNLLLNLYHAVEFQGEYSEMYNNTIDNFCGDAIRALGNNGYFENNLVRDCYIDDYSIQHDDFFQTYKLGNDRMSKNIVIRNNTFKIFDDPVTQFVTDNNLIGTLLQGIIITDGFADSWIVENNLIVSNKEHGISLYGARHCRVQNNTVVQSPLFTDTNGVPKIMLIDQGKTGEANFDNIIRNNLCGQYTPWTYDATSTVENNVDIDQSAYSNYSNYFVDYTANDFHLKEGCLAVDAGVNTALLAKDLDGNNRLQGDFVDAGCYEFNSGYVPANRAPVLATIGNKSVLENVTQTFVISATDADNDILSFTTSSLPSFASIVDNNDGTATFMLQPNTGDAGNYSVSITVSDGAISDEETISITVNSTSPPVGSTITIEANTADQTIYNTLATQWVGYHTHRVGTNKLITAVIPFQILNLASGESITSAKLNFQLLAFAGGLDTKIDLYGLPYRNLATVNTSDFYAGVYNGDANAVALQNGILDNSSIAGAYSSNVNSAIADYINQQIANGAVAGDYVFFRFSINTNDASNYNYWDIASHDNTTASNRPTLDITTETTSMGKKLAVEEFNGEDLNIYPNPVVNNYFNLEIPTEMLDDEIELSVYSASGVEVYRKSISNQKEVRINLPSNTSSGIYILSMSTNGNTYTKKIGVK